MSVNEPPFAPIVRIFPGGNPADESTWGAGHDVSASVRRPGSDGGQPITYSGGRPDEATTVDHGQMNLTLDNRAGDFSTKNPLGAYYPSLRRGTPIRLSMSSGEDDFSRTASGLGTSSGGGAWTTFAAIWSTNGTEATAAFPAANAATPALLGGADAGDLDAYMTAWPTVAATGSDLVYGLGLRAEPGGSELLIFAVCFDTAGVVKAKIFRIDSGGLATISQATLADTYIANDKFRVHAQAVGEDLRLRVWKPADPDNPQDDEPDAWTTTGTDTTLVPATTYGAAGLYMWRTAGNTNVGTVNFKFDDVAYEAHEFTGSVIKWPVDWDKSGNNCWASIAAAGALRRLRQGSQPVLSPLTGQLTGYDHTAYWPLEDGTDATVFGSATSGVRPATMSAEVSPASDSTLAGSSTGPTFTATGAQITGSSWRQQTGTGFAAMFLMKLDNLPGSKTRIVSWRGTGRIVTWNMYIDATPNITIEGVEADGTVTVNTVNAMPFDPRVWAAYQLEAETAGGTVSWANHHRVVGSTTNYSQSGSFSSSLEHRVTAFQLGGSSDLSGAAFSQVWIGENTLPFVTDSFFLVSDGYRGELASDRIQRLCDEGGIPVVVEAGDSEPMGPQRTAPRMSLIEAAADADYGILYEAGNGLGYRPRTARYNQAVSMALSVADRDIDDPPTAVDDDQRVRNDWTVSRDQGASARAIDQDHIDAEGHYPDSVTINVELDDVLEGHASWRRHIGTSGGLRWPDLSLNFASRPSLIPAWRTRPAGFRLTVDTGLSQVAGSDPDVIVEGYAATLWPEGWRVVLSCSAAEPWTVGVYDDTESRYDSASTTVKTDVTSSGTSITFRTVDSGDVWSTTSEPYDVLIAGERLTVTSMGAASLVSGAYDQAATVTRAVNGIEKALAAGEAIHVANPGRWAL